MIVKTTLTQTSSTIQLELDDTNPEHAQILRVLFAIAIPTTDLPTTELGQDTKSKQIKCLYNNLLFHLQKLKVGKTFALPLISAMKVGELYTAADLGLIIDITAKMVGNQLARLAQVEKPFGIRVFPRYGCGKNRCYYIPAEVKNMFEADVFIGRPVLPHLALDMNTIVTPRGGNEYHHIVGSANDVASASPACDRRGGWLTHQERKLRRQQMAQDVRDGCTVAMVAAKYGVTNNTVIAACKEHAEISTPATDVLQVGDRIVGTSCSSESQNRS